MFLLSIHPCISRLPLEFENNGEFWEFEEWNQEKKSTGFVQQSFNITKYANKKNHAKLILHIKFQSQMI